MLGTSGVAVIVDGSIGVSVTVVSDIETVVRVDTLKVLSVTVVTDSEDGEAVVVETVTDGLLAVVVMVMGGTELLMAKPGAAAVF